MTTQPTPTHKPRQYIQREGPWADHKEDLISAAALLRRIAEAYWRDRLRDANAERLTVDMAIAALERGERISDGHHNYQLHKPQHEEPKPMPLTRRVAILIECENDAFHEEPLDEAARILEELAVTLQGTRWDAARLITPLKLYDANGQPVGTCRIQEVETED
jgi:hypothetical protein